MPIDWSKDPNEIPGMSFEDKRELIGEADEEIKKMRKNGAPKSEIDRLQEISNQWFERWDMESRGRGQYNNSAN